MQLVQNACTRASQSPTESIAKVAKSASIAWNMVALQAQRIAELEASNSLLQEKKKRSKKQLQHGGAKCPTRWGVRLGGETRYKSRIAYITMDLH